MPNPNPSPATRFQAGKSGNPGGRPKGSGLTARLRDELEQTDAEGRTAAERIAAVLVAQALAGDIHAIRTILERTDGKVPDRVQFEEVRKAYVTIGPDDLWPIDPETGEDMDPERVATLGLAHAGESAPAPPPAALEHDQP